MLLQKDLERIKKGHKVGGNDICHGFDEGDVGSLRKKFDLPIKNFTNNLLFQINKS